jgi:hypothetical protein
MRSDIDPNSIVRLHLIGRLRWTHQSGTIIQAGDYTGYRAMTPLGERRVFLTLQPGDLGTDWLDITDQAGHFFIYNKDDVASRLAHKLGLSQSPGADVMKSFVKRTRELQQQGRTVDHAAMMTAYEIFPAEFQPTHYAGSGHAMEPLLVDIEKL